MPFESGGTYVKQVSTVHVCLQTMGWCTWALPSVMSFPRVPTGPKGQLHLAGVHGRECALGNGWEEAERGMVMEKI